MLKKKIEHIEVHSWIVLVDKGNYSRISV